MSDQRYAASSPSGEMDSPRLFALSSIITRNSQVNGRLLFSASAARSRWSREEIPNIFLVLCRSFGFLSTDCFFVMSADILNHRFCKCKTSMDLLTSPYLPL